MHPIPFRAVLFPAVEDGSFLSARDAAACDHGGPGPSLPVMSDLYHNRILELAANIPHLGTLEGAEASVLKVSRVCGSTVNVEIVLDESGDHIAAIAVDPKACALGQAATAILSEYAVGASVDEVIAARDAMKAMLKENGPPPEGRFWELRHLQAVADYPPRHTSTLLAFEAAVAAIEQARVARGLAPAIVS